LDKIQEALFFFERGLAMNPDHTSLNNMAGLALFKLERYRDSIPFLERSLRREYSKSIDNILEKAKELQGSADDKSTGQYMQPVMPPSMPMTQAIPVQSTPVSQQAPIYIQVGKIGDQNTSVKDSVVYKSNLTSGQSDKIQICPYCGKDLNFPKTPRFCPFCKEQIMH
jgi:tetratricopeptide (TPR) repeat protein